MIMDPLWNDSTQLHKQLPKHALFIRTSSMDSALVLAAYYCSFEYLFSYWNCKISFFDYSNVKQLSWWIRKSQSYWTRTCNITTSVTEHSRCLYIFHSPIIDSQRVRTAITAKRPSVALESIQLIVSLLFLRLLHGNYFSYIWFARIRLPHCSISPSLAWDSPRKTWMVQSSFWNRTAVLWNNIARKKAFRLWGFYCFRKFLTWPIMSSIVPTDRLYVELVQTIFPYPPNFASECNVNFFWGWYSCHMQRFAGAWVHAWLETAELSPVWPCKTVYLFVIQHAPIYDRRVSDPFCVTNVHDNVFLSPNATDWVLLQEAVENFLCIDKERKGDFSDKYTTGFVWFGQRPGPLFKTCRLTKLCNLGWSWENPSHRPKNQFYWLEWGDLYLMTDRGRRCITAVAKHSRREKLDPSVPPSSQRIENLARSLNAIRRKRPAKIPYAFLKSTSPVVLSIKVWFCRNLPHLRFVGKAACVSSVSFPVPNFCSSVPFSRFKRQMNVARPFLKNKADPQNVWKVKAQNIHKVRDTLSCQPLIR